MRYLKLYDSYSAIASENNPVIPSVSYAEDTQNLIYLGSTIPLYIVNSDKIVGSIEINGASVQLDGATPVYTKVNCPDGYITIGNITSNDSEKTTLVYASENGVLTHSPSNIEEILSSVGETLDSMYETFSKVVSGEITPDVYIAKCTSSKLYIQFDSRDRYNTFALSGSGAKYNKPGFSEDAMKYFFILFVLKAEL